MRSVHPNETKNNDFKNKINEEEQEKQAETPALTKETSAATDEMKEEEIMNHHSNVEQILELLCLLGAGYWRLCQVSDVDSGDGGTNLYSY